MNYLVNVLYIVAFGLFILGLSGLTGPKTAVRGNWIAATGMGIAVVATLIKVRDTASINWILIVAGLAIGVVLGVPPAKKTKMTAMPQLVAAFHSLVGMAAVFVAAAAMYNPAEFGITTPEGLIKTASRLEMGLGAAIGAITFSGSVIAFAKLQALMSGAPILLPSRHQINIGIAAAIVVMLLAFMFSESAWAFWLMTILAFAIGFLLIIPIGGADMPVVISMLNSYSGWAAAGIGFTLENPALIITGALVGSSGAILSYIMCHAMNRSFISVILGGFGETGGAVADAGDKTVKPGSAEDAAFIMQNASKVIIVPGYGMAVAQAQHAVRELMDELTKAGVDVRFAIHPVAGRMPGHMNVLLAEAQVPYDVVEEREEINNDFQSTDVAYVIGANDITNPAAREDPQSPIYGMPILDVDKAKAVFFVKRSLAAGYAGIDNSLFYKPNTMMLFGDAKKMTEEIVRSLE